jgi:hypothetical protein
VSPVSPPLPMTDAPPAKAPAPTWSERLTVAAPFLALIALNLAFRFPLLLNANGVHSDAAITGLQSMHILNGEHSRFLWGADYQGSFDAYVIAAFFAIGGPTPMMLMLAPFFGHLLMCCAVLALLIRTLGNRAAALIACLPLAFTPQAINGVVAYAPRQWSITFAVCGAVIIAWPSKRLAPLRIALGLCLGIFALYPDMFSLQWMPGLGLLAVLVAFDPPRDVKSIAFRLVGGIAAALAAAYVVRSLRDTGQPKQHGFGFDFALIPRNWPLFSETCLPWLLGAKVWIPGKNLYPDLWVPPAPVKAFQYFGAGSAILLGLASAAVMFMKRVPWEVKRIVLFGGAAACTALGGFLVSGWPSDMWSTRYLAPVVWSMPFTFAALAYVLRPRGFLVLLAPYLAVAAMGGWLSFGPYVDGPLPRLDDRGSAKEELAVGEFLRSRGYDHGYAQYWLAHRLTFLWREHPAISSFEWDRYPPYRQAADQAKRKAFIFHPSEPRAQPQPYIQMLQSRPGRLEVHQVAGFTVLLFEEPS